MDKIKTINSCRLCDSNNIDEVLNFGEVALANNYRDSADLTDEFLAPLVYFQCRNCGSVQLRDQVDSSILFSNYSYSSPPNLRSHFEEFAKTVSKNINLCDKQLIVEIGGNNGICGQEFKKLGFSNVINVEPAANIAKISQENGINTLNRFFNKETANEIYRLNEGPARLITASNVLAHVDSLNEIVESVKLLLSEDGYLVFENCYLLNTVFSLDAGQCYSEHIQLHSIKPLDIFFKKHGLEICEIELNKIQLGSFRIYVTWPANNSYTSSSVKNLIKLEEDFGLYKKETYEDFTEKVTVAGNELRVKLINIIANNGKIALYGVPAKIVLLIKSWELEQFISYAVDDSPLKQGKFVPGTKIPIKNSEFWRADNPAATLVGAYNFADDIIKNNPQYPKENWIIPFK